jgi:phytoene/squalene synthetase
LDIDWHIVGLKDFDQIYDGKKFKANYGEVELKVFSRVIADWSGSWKKDRIAKSFRNVFFKRTMKAKMEIHKNLLHNDTQRLLDAAKTYLKLRTYSPEPELARFGWNKDMEPL